MYIPPVVSMRVVERDSFGSGEEESEKYVPAELNHSSMQLRIMDTVGTSILSIVRRLSLRRRFFH